MRLELAKLHKELGAHDDLRHPRPGRGDDAGRPRSSCSTAARIAQVGAPLDLYHRPENKFVASFIGSPAMNFLAAAGRAPTAARPASPRPAARPVTARLRASARRRRRRPRARHPPRAHRAQPPPAAPPRRSTAAIGMVEHLGHTTMLYVDTPAGQRRRRGRRRSRSPPRRPDRPRLHRPRPPLRPHRPRPVTRAPHADRLPTAKHRTPSAKAMKGLARPKGFEPLASAFGGQRSIQLSYGRLRRLIGQGARLRNGGKPRGFASRGVAAYRGSPIQRRPSRPAVATKGTRDRHGA